MLDLLVDEYHKFLDWKEFLSPTRSTKEEFQEFHRFRHKKDMSFDPFVTSPRNQLAECMNKEEQLRNLYLSVNSKYPESLKNQAFPHYLIPFLLHKEAKGILPGEFQVFHIK